jgi:hypothetical protein
MRLKYLVLITSLLLPIAVTPATALTPAGLRLVADAVGNCGNPCVVVSNNGGRIVSFNRAGDAIRRGAGQPLVISGYCASACMVLAARARPRACITPSATFAYHKTNWNRPIPLSSDLHRWVMQHGGYPEFGATPGVMPNQVAQRFWRAC